MGYGWRKEEVISEYCTLHSEHRHTSLTCLPHDGVDHADPRDGGQGRDELVAVLLELEVHGRGVEDGPDEVALGGGEAGPDHQRPRVPAPGLDDAGAAAQRVPLVSLHTPQSVVLG